MLLPDYKIKYEYRSPGDNMPKEFYIPLLQAAVSYKRSVGFFSSTALIDISKGISALVQNGGHIEMIASPHLSEEDIKAINEGYVDRDARIEQILLSGMDSYTDYFATERLNLLANLIASGKMDFKVAFLMNKKGIGIYHEKLGIITDAEGNKVAFSGSMNESGTAFEDNYETIDVYTSWSGGNDLARVNKKEDAFDTFWRDKDKYVRTVDFPNVTKAIIEKYKTKEPNYHIDDEQFPKPKEPYYPIMDDQCRELKETKPVQYGEEGVVEKKITGARIPEDIKLFDYQNKAISEWVSDNYRGIYDMATGTGKTLTGLGSVARVSEDVHDYLAVFIICPYQHLVDQWVEDVVRFNIDPIIAYSGSPQKNWERRLKNAVRDQGLRKDKGFFCLVTTYATFKTKTVQEIIDRIKAPRLIVADEAHNAGASGFIGYLDNRFEYRLALSATLERHMDEAGTGKLYDFFGRPCIHYTLEEAIKQGKLTPYKYYTIPVYLTEDELIQYKSYTMQMAQCLTKDKKSGRLKLNTYGKQLAIKRAHLVAGAINKLNALKEAIRPYKDDDNILVYCGATNVNYDSDVSSTDDGDLKQIEAITRILGNELDMRVAKFTAEEKIDERERIKTAFAKGDLQAIAAIKCLDEGMNVPGIRTAFILASSTNPKEYIQRRGRVLRKAPGKEYAEIYDFVTLPRDIDDVGALSTEEKKGDLTLVKNEIRRMKEFSRVAKNPVEASDLIWDLQSAYGITDEDISKMGDGDDEFYN